MVFLQISQSRASKHIVITPVGVLSNIGNVRRGQSIDQRHIGGKGGCGQRHSTGTAGGVIFHMLTAPVFSKRGRYAGMAAATSAGIQQLCFEIQVMQLSVEQISCQGNLPAILFAYRIAALKRERNM